MARIADVPKITPRELAERNPYWSVEEVRSFPKVPEARRWAKSINGVVYSLQDSRGRHMSYVVLPLDR